MSGLLYGSGGQARHPEDWDLMRSLGLKTNFNRDWTDVGTVPIVGPSGKVIARIKVEVAALPAQFFRFTIQKGTTKVMTTGSGRFAEYWPHAVSMAYGQPHSRQRKQLIERNLIKITREAA